MKKVPLLLFFALGFFSLLSQTLIIREFIISFGGNELGISLFYFFWLFWVGIGALLALTFLGKFLDKHFLKLLVFYPLMSFGEIILFITLRGLAGVSWWEFFSLERIFLYLFFFTTLISLFTGIIFTQGILWLKQKEKGVDSTIISYAYIIEALGSFTSGCIVTLLISKLVSPFIILLWSGLFFTFIVLIVSFNFREKVTTISNFILLVIILFFISHPQRVTDFFQNSRVKNLLPYGKIIKEVYTPYQHVLLGDFHSQRVVLSNGEIITTLPEIAEADRESALFISMSDSPKRILIFGYGAENVIASLLKFPVKSVTYVMEDKIYYETIYNNLPKDLKTAFSDKRFKVVFQSPRLFLKENKEKFSLAVIYTSDPSSLVLNSFFTKEFYSLIKNNLEDKGVVASRITSAENFIGEEIRNYGSSLYYTLKEVFPEIVIVPGEINWFFAGCQNSYLTDDIAVLEERFKRASPLGFSFPTEGFRSMFSPQRVEFVKRIYIDNPLFGNTNLINQDQKPLAFFLNLLVLSRYSNSFLIQFFKGVLFAGISIFLIPLLIFFMTRIIFLLRIENVKNKRIIFDIKLFQFFSGFLGFSFHLILIFLFQNRFGTIFQFIGLVNALFMLGLCIGGILGKVLKTTLQVITGVLIIQVTLILTAYPIFIALSLPSGGIFSLFIIFFLISGILTGSSYPLCAKIWEDNNTPLVNTAVNLELLDHWGGALAGLITGLFMLPVLGVLNTMISLFFVGVSLIILFVIEIISPRIFVKERKAGFLSFPYIRTSYVLFAISLSFIINAYFLEKHKGVWEAKPPLVVQAEECLKQEIPFPAYICKSEEGSDYLLETKDFAPDIKGFVGPINLSIRISREGEIRKVEVIEHRETTSYIKDISKFLQQFTGRSLDEEFSLKNIDAVSGATITSQAIVDIVNETAKKVNPVRNSILQQYRISNGVKQGLKGEVYAKSNKEKIIIDIRAVYLIVFTLLAVALYLLSRHQKFFGGELVNIWLRKIYLFLVVIFSGFIFNLTFSFVHLGNLLMFNFSFYRFLSQTIIYLIPLLLGILFGQFWCGWLCPFGALQELLGRSKLSLKVSLALDRKSRYFKYVFLAFFIVVISFKKDTSLFKQEPLSAFFLEPLRVSLDKLLSIIVLIFSVFFLRYWCRYFCLCGAFFSLFNKISLLRKFFVKRYKNCCFDVKGVNDIDCIQCNLCMIKIKSKSRGEVPSPD